MAGVYEGTLESKTGYFNASDIRFTPKVVDKQEHLSVESKNLDCRQMVSQNLKLIKINFI